MSDRLYEHYEGVYLQQAELFEEAAVAGVRAAIGGFNRGYLQMLRSVAMPRQPSSNLNANGNSSSNQQLLIHAQEEIDAARDSAQRQLATALANGFRALANLSLPSSPGVSNQPSVSGIFNQINEQEEANAISNGNANISDDDSVSIKSEDNSECESDYESHSDEMEIKQEATEEDQIEIAATGCTSGNVKPNNDNVSVRMEIESECESSDSDSSSDEEEFASGQIKVENDKADAIDQLMDNSQEQANIDTDDGNTANEQVDNSLDNRDEEQHDSQAFYFHVFDGPESDAETIIDEAFAQEASNESVQSTPTLDLGSLPSTSTGRRHRSTRAKKKVNFTVTIIEDSSDGAQEDSTVNRNGKRPKRLSRKASTPKRAHAEPVGAAVEEEETAKKLTIIVHYLKCTEKGCKKKCTDIAQLDGHLLAKHKIEKYRCKVKGCSQSFAEQDELTDHRQLAHRKLKNLPCDKCETTWKSFNDLSTHFGHQHLMGRFQCSASKCAFTGKTRLQVRNHYQRKHTHERPFACEECHKVFTQKSTLTVHKRIHSGLKLYRCKWPGCEHSAITRSNVSVHVRVHHFGLPGTKKEQTERGITDTRDAREFIEKITSN